MLSQNKRGVVYGIPYKDFDKVYTGEMGRTSKYKTHLTNGNREDSMVATKAHQQLHD